ncbi:MAG: NfeD family protein [Acidimicrobiales bacterium]
MIEVSGLIDPIQADFITRALERADADGVEVVVMRLDSKDGVLDGDRLLPLLNAIVTSRVPVTAWVGPGRASRADGQAALVLNATRIRGFAPGATSDGRGPTGAELESATLGDFIVNLDGKRVGGRVLEIPLKVVERDGRPPQRELAVGAQVRFDEPSLLAQLLHGVASPTAAYLLLVVGLLLMVFEFYTAGVGVAAGVALASLGLSAYGLGVLPTRPVGLALVGLGVIGFSIDVQAGVPRVWTGIGTVAFVLGSVGLYDGFRVPWAVLVLVLASVALFMVSGMPAVIRTRFSTPTIGRESMIGEVGAAVSAIDPEGVVKVRAAVWRARTNRATPIQAGEELRVAAVDGLVLEVEPLEGAARDAGH